MISSCCKNCAKPAEVAIGPVNDVVNATVTPTCDCHPALPHLRGFNIWWPAEALQAVGPELASIEKRIRSLYRDGGPHMRLADLEATCEGIMSDIFTLTSLYGVSETKGHRDGTEPAAVPSPRDSTGESNAND